MRVVGVSSVSLSDDDVRHVVHFVKLQVLRVRTKKTKQHVSYDEQENQHKNTLIINSGVNTSECSLTYNNNKEKHDNLNIDLHVNIVQLQAPPPFPLVNHCIVRS